MEYTPYDHNNDPDDIEAPETRKRNPLEVMQDWLADRQRMLEDHETEDDDEEEDDDSDSPKGHRISKALKGLFGRNVEKAPVENGELPAPPSLIGGVVELDEKVTPETPEPSAPETAEEAAPAAESLTIEQNEETVPTATVPEQQPDDDEEDDTTTVTTGQRHMASPVVPPIVVPGSGSGNSGGPNVSNPNVGGNTSPPTPNNAPTGGGNFTPLPPQTIMERERVIEHKTGGKAALAALVIAERIDHHRNEKRKEQIEKVEKAQEIFKKQNKERIEQIEHDNRKATAERLQVGQVESRPVAHPEMPTPLTAEAPLRGSETTPSSRPQSVAEVLEQRKALHPEEAPPRIEELEHGRQRTEEHLEREDILVAAEKLASRATENIAHEVYDERWHEIKDRDDLADAAAIPKTSIVNSTLPDDTSSFSVSTSQPTQSGTPMINPRSDMPQATSSGHSAAANGLWAALIVGVIVGLLLILM